MEKNSLKIWPKKRKRHIDETFKLRNIYCTKKLHYYYTKDKVPEYLKSHIVYELCCPACNSKYIGKTDQNFSTHIQEHSGSDKKSPVYNFCWSVSILIMW